MESDRKTLSHRKLFCKYADGTNLIVPGNSDIGLNEEFINIDKNLAIANKSRVSCAHNTLRASIGINITP